MLGLRLGVGVAQPARAGRLSAQTAQPPVGVVCSAQQQQRTRASAEASTSKRVSTATSRSWSAKDGTARLCGLQPPVHATALDSPPVPIPDPRRFWDNEDIAWDVSDKDSWRLPKWATGATRRERSELASNFENKAGMRKIVYTGDYRCATPATVEVIEPEGFKDGTTAPVVMLLPFYAGSGPEEIGDGMFEVERLNFVKDTGAVVVRPIFNTWSLFVDGTDDAHESYMNEVLVPFLKKTYGNGPISLISFGYGGWSALNLLLRRPDLYHQAAVFNSPLMLSAPEPDTPLEDAFPTKEDMRPYALPSLVEDDAVAAPFRSGKPRIGLFAGPNPAMARSMFEFSNLLGENGILHTYCEDEGVLEASSSWEPAVFVVAEEEEPELEAAAAEDDGIRSLDEEEDEEAAEEDEDDIMMLDETDDLLGEEEEEDGLPRPAAAAKQKKARAKAKKAAAEEDEALAGPGEAEGWDGSGGEEEGAEAAGGAQQEEAKEEEIVLGPSWLEFALSWTQLGMKGGEEKAPAAAAGGKKK